MPVNSFDNSILYNAKSFDELIKHAILYPNAETMTTITIFGENMDVDTGVPEDIWAAGGIKVDLTTAEFVEIYSSSANDSSAGTGARAVFIQGVDQDFNEIQDIIVTNGTTVVTSNLEFLAINRAVCISTGSFGTNFGDIFFEGASTGAAMVKIPNSAGINQASHYVVPAGITAYQFQTISAVYRADGGQDRQGEILQRVDVEGLSKYRTFKIGTISNTVDFKYPIPIVIPEKSRIKFTAEVGHNNSRVMVQYSLLLINNDYL